MIVEVIAIGTEMLLGQIVNTNAAEIGQRLAAAGLDHYHQVVVGDNLARCADAINTAMRRADAVIITGGIGPTQDDLTREAIAAATGTELVLDEEQAEHLRQWWANRDREMPTTNLRQAFRPAGADLIPNPKGTAPGIHLEAGGTSIIALPGVPAEMLPMLERDVLPMLVRKAGGRQGVLVSRLIRTWGESESRVAELLADLFAAGDNPTIAFLASAGEIKVRITARAATAEAAAELIAPVESEVRDRLGVRVFSSDDETIERLVLGMIGDRGWTLGTAESATAGLVAARLASVPGASKVLRGSIIPYDASLKESLLHVPPRVIVEHGVVSEPTAIAMATGGATALGADVVVAVTGSAGPEPLEKRSGTMVFAVRTPEDVRARTLRLPGDRERVRTYAATTALHLVRLAVAGEWWT